MDFFDDEQLDDEELDDEELEDEEFADPAMEAFFLVAEWLSQPNHREQRRFLEEHPELLNDGTEQVLRVLQAVFSKQPEELRQLVQGSEDRITEVFERYKLLIELLGTITGGMQLLKQERESSRDCLKALEAIRKSGGTTEAIRTTYVNLFSGLVLDMPKWLEEAIQQIVRDPNIGQQTPKQGADRWHAIIERAKQDKDVPAEVIAALWHEQAIVLLSDASSSRAESLQQAIAAWENALEIFTPERYPVQHAKFQTNLAQAYARYEREERKNAEKAIQASQAALDLLASTSADEDTGEALVSLGMAHLSRAQAGYNKADCEKAIQCFLNALHIYKREIFPEQWATCQMYLGIAYELFAANEDSKYLERATGCFQEALQFYTREAFPEQWAMIHMYFGLAYSPSTAKGRAKSTRDALEHFWQALEVFTRETFPEQWARLQTLLGDLYAEDPGGENFDLALHYYKAALEVFTLDKYPLEWARCCDNLGKLYGNVVEARDSEQQELAIHYLEAALQVYERDKYPDEWATVQTNLGNMYHKRLQGDKRENIKQAIQFYTKALQVFEEIGSTSGWANVKSALAVAYQDLGGDEASNFEQAIADCEAALQIYTRNTYPEEWAGAQQNLGILYLQREKGIRSENLERAIRHLLAALQVFTRDEYPYKWAMTYRNLGLAYSHRVQGERADNIERAISYNTAVLDVYTHDEFPHHWTTTQVTLANLYNERIWGDKRENQEKALNACQMALFELSRDTYPMEWASAQLSLGDIYEGRLAGERSENLTRAAVCYEGALQLYPLERYPSQHRITQLGLARVRGRQGNWQAVHEAYVQARKAEDILIRLGAGLVGQHLAIGRWREARDTGARDGFALIRLGKMEEGVVAIERGQARVMAASLIMNTADPMQIKNIERRERYIRAQQAFIEAQAELNTPLPPGLSENERRLKDLEHGRAFRAAQAHLEEVIQEIRATHDPADFLEDSMSIKTILDAAARGGAGHALVYLMATPWRGMAVAVFGSDANHSPRITRFDLPDLLDHTIADLLAVNLTEKDRSVIGGFGYAQEHAAFGLLLRDWHGLSFEGYAENLHDACFLESKVGMLDQAAQDILSDPDVRHIIAQPLKSLEINDFYRLMHMLNERFLRLELQRVLQTLAKAGIPQLVDWLVKQGTTSITVVPCGWLATLPLAAIPCIGEKTMAEILPTSVTPNAYALLQSFNPGKRERLGVYTLGNPRPERDSLPWGEAEALTIAKLARTLNVSGGTRIQFQAKRDWLIDALQRGYVVDASCHGRYDRHDFLHSALLLTGGQELALGDVLSHKVDLRGLRLFMLSACQTASAEMQGAAANEVKSLAAGMLQAGAQAVLASLWPVDDKATFILMVYFAQQWLPRMESEPPAVALARAQHWLRTVTNGKLQRWETTALPPVTSEEQREAGAADERVLPSEEEGMSLSERVASATRSYRYDMDQAAGLIHDMAKKSDPDERPYADPMYWAGFQVTGW